ncbi:protein kinase [Acidobacteria bacterium AH-259-D05]|nr:protein kinase [Acidobacteria bacterium AH-259-D05]
MIGTTLSHYKVIEKIGQGGMGEVYRAKDTNLSREVAIKVLPEQFTQDPQRLARFEREAKLLASLNHPAIAAIYSFEHSDDIHFLVLELVEGETLAERVAKGPLPVEEALEVCRQIAEGVEAAHEKGVIHRDLKPANVKVTPEGKVKILDFGLAKAFESEVPVTDISQSPTLTEEMTRAGVILGTAAYMSPEQARGKPVDKRADIFALGAVLYELLTGKRVFEGETITETIAAVLKSEPDWEGLPENTPSIIRFLLNQCLEKDAHERLQHVGDARIQIKNALKEPATTSPIGVIGAVQPAHWKSVIRWSLASLVVGTIIASLAVWNLKPQLTSAPQSIRRYRISPLPNTRLGGAGAGNYLTLSSDGRYLVYIAVDSEGRQLYLQSLDSFEPTVLPGTEGAHHPFFSPDGRWVAFFADGKLKKVLLSGGSTITVTEAGKVHHGGTWGSDGRIIFGQSNDVLMQVPDSGGAPEALSTFEEGETDHLWPELLPGGKALLFTIFRGDLASSRIAVLSLETKERRILLDEQAYNARYAPTGHIIYARGGTLMAVPFDVQQLEVVGTPVPILENVSYRGGGAVDFSFSREGSLVYISGVNNTLVWLDREGRTFPVTETKRQTWGEPRLSPDGQHLALTDRDGGPNIWIYEMARGIFTPINVEGSNQNPVWTPDGKRLTFSSGPSGRSDIFWMPADGSGDAEQLTTSEELQTPTSWSPDGVLAYSEGTVSESDIWTLSLEDERSPQSFLATRFSEKQPVFSPDGRWIAFTSDQSGRDEIYVKSYPDEGGITSISTDGGNQPVWARNGRELFYRDENKVMVVPIIQTEPTFQAETPRLLVEGPLYYAFVLTSQYDISPDGKRFVMVKEGGYDLTQINVVENWFEELKRLVPTDN